MESGPRVLVGFNGYSTCVFWGNLVILALEKIKNLWNSFPCSHTRTAVNVNHINYSWRILSPVGSDHELLKFCHKFWGCHELLLLFSWAGVGSSVRDVLALPVTHSWPQAKHFKCPWLTWKRDSSTPLEVELVPALLNQCLRGAWSPQNKRYLQQFSTAREKSQFLAADAKAVWGAAVTFC